MQMFASNENAYSSREKAVRAIINPNAAYIAFGRYLTAEVVKVPPRNFSL